MEIRKRNGEMAAFNAEKIRAAMRLAFTATNVEITEQSLNSLLRAVLKRLEEVQQLTVENVQDQVEQQLMAEGYYETAKAYILYREKRAKARAIRERIAARMEDPSLEGTLREIEADFDSAKYSLNLLAEQYERLIREGMSVREQEKILPWRRRAGSILRHGFKTIFSHGPSGKKCRSRTFKHFRRSCTIWQMKDSMADIF